MNNWFYLNFTSKGQFFLLSIKAHDLYNHYADFGFVKVGSPESAVVKISGLTLPEIQTELKSIIQKLGIDAKVGELYTWDDETPCLDCHLFCGQSCYAF